jgi:ligand-binding sensor domain-containing protein/signal transduction histidine kinase/DNA-binding response OmpR family regulator
MRSKRGLIILLLMGSLSTVLTAQIGTFYTTDNELISSSLINFIYQDRRDYIWIATEDGLNKYDGVKFTIYKNRPNDSTTIKNNYISSLFEDSFGNFWVGCINTLHLYDRATDRFSKVKLYNDTRLTAPHITSIIESKNHDIWMTTSGEGIVRIKKDDKIYHTDNELTKRLSSLYLTTMIEDQKGRFWIASENQGLNMYDPVADKVVVFQAPQSIGSNQISALCEDHQGNLFVGTLNNGVYKFNPATQKFELIPDAQGLTLSVRNLLLDNTDHLLVGTDGQGIRIYNEEKQQFENSKMLSAPFDLSKMKVHAILQDHAGNIWMGLFQKGVFLNSNNSNKFNYWGHKSYHQNIIGSGCVMSLLKDKEGVLWVGTDNDGIYKLDQQGRSYHFAPGNNSVPYTVMSLIEDDAGNIWGGSFLQGLFRLEKKTGRCIYYPNRPDTMGNTAQNKIFCFAKDNRNRLWIGTNGAGVYVFDLQRMEYVDHYSQWSTDRHIPNDWINCIWCDKSGIMWIGSYDGFFNVNPDNHCMEDLTKPEILPGKVVYSIHEDKKGNLWLGTPVGLACFNKQTRTSVIYTIQNGLPSNVICAILEDKEENLWLSTHSGISKLKVSVKEFVNYYAFDGLQGNEFTMGAACQSESGELFFGGTGGVTSFMPGKINDQRIPLYLHLTGLYLKDKPIVSGQKSGNREIINKFISDVDTICLRYEDNMFALEFSTFDFGFSGRIYYKYMLEGFNSQWMTTEPGVNRISFTNMNYGTYKLRIKAFIYNTSSEEKVLTIVIRPPWYLTWWAKLIYCVLFVLVTGGITWFILEKIRHKNELLRREHAEQINEAKLQFFINVSHEIRTPMTLIIGPLEKLLMKNNPIDLHNTYLLIYRNAQRILRLINQLMDVRKIDKKQMQLKFRETDMVGFIKDIMKSFEYAAQMKNINFTFNPEMSALKVWIDLNNFDKVVFNVFSNAFKFTPVDGEITVELTTGTDSLTNGPLKNYFEIQILDSGIGIDKEKIEKIFDRFYQIDSEVTNSNFGTGIGLHLSRSLVELQYGIIYAENRTDRTGSCFIIRMPLGKEHLKEEAIEIIPENMPMQTFAYSRKEDLFDIDMDSDMATTGHAKTKYRVLIVDDDRDINNYVKAELDPLYKVIQASNGKEALEYILSKKPDLVISDVMMPEMDGITLCRKIKSNVNINYIPVILLTAKSEDKDWALGLDIDADAYIVKPFNPEILKKTVSNLLSNRERLKDKFHNQMEGKMDPIELQAFDDVLMEKILKIINANLSNPKLNVEMLGDGVGFSRVHIHRKLKELTGQSARDFIRTIRLEQAKILLKQKNLTISQVADAVGFVSLSHFSASFREFYGISPKEFMESESDI